MSKSSKNRDRRAMVEQMRRQAKAAERRRTMTVLAVCVVVALIIVSLAGWSIWRDQREKDALANTQLADIGVAASAAGCLPIKEDTATGSGQHTTAKVTYDSVPPNSGPHNPSTADSGIHFYTASDRPDVELLVHNLEHGWTIAWYDDSIANDAAKLRQLKATADKFDAHGSDPRYNLIIAPWTKDDGGGKPIPDGKHISFAHWSVHKPADQVPSTSNVPKESFGVSEACTSYSGAALDAFMKKYPYDDAPEGYRWHQ